MCIGSTLGRNKALVTSKEGYLLIPAMSMFCDFTNIIFRVKTVRRELVKGSGYNDHAVPENVVPYLPHRGSTEIPRGRGVAKTNVF